MAEVVIGLVIMLLFGKPALDALAKERLNNEPYPLKAWIAEECLRTNLKPRAIYERIKLGRYSGLILKKHSPLKIDVMVTGVVTYKRKIYRRFVATRVNRKYIT